MPTAETTTDFSKARLGSAALQVCCVCGSEMGNVLMKTHGNPNGPEFVGRHVAVKDDACEFCIFVPRWMAHVGIAPGTKKCGAAKLVEGDERKLLAFVPFTEDEDRKKRLEDGTEFELGHAMVVRVEQRPSFLVRSETETEDMDPDRLGEPLYWSNETGWCDKGSADVFSSAERDALTLPLGGIWEETQRMVLVEILERGV